jgi:dTDP-4-amino-4,6-dideoxygalactose transaminase
MKGLPIPFNRVAPLGNEASYVSRAISSGQISGDQAYGRSCQEILQKLLGVKRVLVTTSCTHALEMAAILLKIRPGDEVIIPSFTFVSTVNAFVLRGAKPVFCDIRHDTLNMDETKIEELLTENTRAIVPVHYAGVSCEMDSIMEIAEGRGISVVEDNAHGLFGKYKGRWLGSIGCMATQSFHATKNITCGEGGALILNDESYVERAEIIREKGTDRARYFRGEIDKYSWVDVGSSYVLSDILSAFLFAQLEVHDTIQSRREAVWRRYNVELRDWCLINGVLQPFVPPECEQAFHMYYLVMPDAESRTALLAHLKMNGVSAVFHYLPLNRSEYFLGNFKTRQDCPVTESISERIVRLPFFSDLSASDQEHVIGRILEF